MLLPQDASLTPATTEAGVCSVTHMESSTKPITSAKIVIYCSINHFLSQSGLVFSIGCSQASFCFTLRPIQHRVRRPIRPLGPPAQEEQRVTCSKMEAGTEPAPQPVLTNPPAGLSAPPNPTSPSPDLHSSPPPPGLQTLPETRTLTQKSSSRMWKASFAHSSPTIQLDPVHSTL